MAALTVQTRPHRPALAREATATRTITKALAVTKAPAIRAGMAHRAVTATDHRTATTVARAAMVIRETMAHRAAQAAREAAILLQARATTVARVATVHKAARADTVLQDKAHSKVAMDQVREATALSPAVVHRVALTMATRVARKATAQGSKIKTMALAAAVCRAVTKIEKATDREA